MIDAHHHIWTLSRGDYDWNTPDLAIHRDYGLDDLRPLLGDHSGTIIEPITGTILGPVTGTILGPVTATILGPVTGTIIGPVTGTILGPVTGTILVQAAATEAETDFMLARARESGGLVRGVVGWLDLAAPDAPSRVTARAADMLLVGLRPMLQDLDDRAWILRPEVAPGLAAMAREGLVFDALVRAQQISQVTEIAARHPDLSIVLDHAGKPAIARGAFAPWAADIAALARETNVVCKLSGLVTEAAPGWAARDLQPYVEHLLATFGPQRLLWGSDWPVVDLAGGYGAWRAATASLLAGVDEADRAAILGGTAAHVYLARARR